MTLNLVVTTPPGEEPVSLTNAKAQMRVDSSTEDTLIGIYIAAAREKCEEVSRRAFVTQTLTLSLDEWPDADDGDPYTILLPRPPLQSVTSVKYTDYLGVEHTLSSASYIVDTYREPGRIVLKSESGYSWPADVLRETGAIKIVYVAGFGAATAVPKKYQMAVQLLAAHYYENREATSVTGTMEIPFGVQALLNGDKGWL